MTTMIRFIAISIFILAETMFYSFCPTYAINVELPAVGLTNWSILYFSLSFLCPLIFCIEGIVKERSKTLKIFLIVYSLFFVSLIGIDVTKIGMPYDKYLLSIGNTFYAFIMHTFFIVTLAFVIFISWYKLIKKRLCHGNRLKT